ncbi:MAG TPA: SDR family oxidoreductase, partial [Phycisphaerae bacterium]|nr:SDR family oxidoreductase [Phycisphaerae bacterium]
TVLITGASSGIGASLARRFARAEAKVILVARRADRLAELADDLRVGGFAGQSAVIVADLTEPKACERIYADTLLAAGRVDVLVNNAGIGEYGDLAHKDLAALEHMMQLNMNSLLRLTHLILPEMISRRSGWILNVASTAAFQPTPHMAVYGATKSFVFSLSLALREELRNKGIVVTCLCPGSTRTGFFDRGGYETRRREFTRLSADPEDVADKAYRALARGRAFCVPGVFNKVTTFLQRLVPRTTTTRLVGKILGSGS